MLLLLELGELLGDLGTVRADLTMMTKFTSLAKLHLAHVTREGLLARVRILMLLLVLRQAEGLRAEAAF